MYLNVFYWLFREVCLEEGGRGLRRREGRKEREWEREERKEEEEKREFKEK